MASRAVLQGGLITLLDEPTAALGVRAIQKVIDIVVNLREAGHAILLIRHNLDTVFEISDHIAVIRLGRKLGDVRTSDATRGASSP